MSVWLICTTAADNMCFEKAFETERAAKMYIEEFGNPTWIATPTFLETEDDMERMLKELASLKKRD